MKAKVTELTHDELVDILSTALYGCDYLGIDWDDDEWKLIPENKKTGNCVEDKCADLLLNDKTIRLYDMYTDGDIYGSKGKPVEGEEIEDWGQNAVVYKLKLQDFLDACSTEEGIRYATELLIKEDGDYFIANNLLQIAMFGEIIYG